MRFERSFNYELFDLNSIQVFKHGGFTVTNSYEMVGVILLAKIPTFGIKSRGILSVKINFCSSIDRDIMFALFRMINLLTTLGFDYSINVLRELVDSAEGMADYLTQIEETNYEI